METNKRLPQFEERVVKNKYGLAKQARCHKPRLGRREGLGQKYLIKGPSGGQRRCPHNAD